MSTTIYETPDDSLVVTQYAGPVFRAINGDRRRIQLSVGREYVQMGRQEFIDWLEEVLRRMKE